jgi:putative transposase
MRKVKFSPGVICHLYNRGVDKRKIFLKESDYWRFLQGLFLFNDTKTSESLLWELENSHGAINFKVIKDYFAENNLIRDPLIKIMVDCFMPNHYHLLVEEVKPGGISKFMHKLGTGYTMYFNKKYNRTGSLFQGTFKAVLVDEEDYLKYLAVYINVMNPGQLIEPNLKKVGIKNKQKVMDFAESYLWGTHKEYLQTRDSIVIDKGLLGNIFPDSRQYRNFASSVMGDKSRFDAMPALLIER